MFQLFRLFLIASLNGACNRFSDGKPMSTSNGLLVYLPVIACFWGHNKGRNKNFNETIQKLNCWDISRVSNDACYKLQNIDITSIEFVYNTVPQFQLLLHEVEQSFTKFSRLTLCGMVACDRHPLVFNADWCYCDAAEVASSVFCPLVCKSLSVKHQCRSFQTNIKMLGLLKYAGMKIAIMHCWTHRKKKILL